jgi:predicted nucleotidyltransferase
VRIFYPAQSRDDLIRRLQERLPALAARLPLRRVVLFGSYASGRFTAASDIDLLVVHDGPPRDDAYALVRRTLSIPRLEPHVYSLEEYEAARATVARMERGGITLLGDPGPLATQDP